jgi:transcriptional regulator
MYLPPQFKAKDAAHAHALMREHPFASLISNDDDGFPFVTHLPLNLVPGANGAPDVLLGHCARPNPHWRYLQARPSALVCFMGPQAYMSPAVYPDLVRVPTWSYLAVHCKVQARLVEAAAAKDALLKKLIADHEPGYAVQWKSLDPEWADKMLSGIVGFELEITQIEAKLKLNQHRPEAHQAMFDTYSQSDSESARGLAQWMRRLGMVANKGA